MNTIHVSWNTRHSIEIISRKMRTSAGRTRAVSRRAVGVLVSTLLAVPPVPPPAWAGSRVTAQSVGIDEFPLGSFSIVWGGNQRCDPTDAICRQGGLTIEGGAAAQAQPLLLVETKVTKKVVLDLSINQQNEGQLVIALFGDDAPESVDAFMRLCAGTLISDPDDEPAALARSTLIRVQRDKAIVLGGLKQQGGSTRLVAGKTRPQRFPVAPPATSDRNALPHDRAGLLSVRRGGGSFEMIITPRANAALDGQNIVIGQVVEGMELLERLNMLPTNNYDRAPLATVKIDKVALL